MRPYLKKSIVAGALCLGMASPSFAGLILKSGKPNYTQTINIFGVTNIIITDFIITGAQPGETIVFGLLDYGGFDSVTAASLPSTSIGAGFGVSSPTTSPFILTIGAGLGSEFTLESFVYNYVTAGGNIGSVTTNVTDPETPLSVSEPSSLALIATAALCLVGASRMRCSKFARLA